MLTLWVGLEAEHGELPLERWDKVVPEETHPLPDRSRYKLS